MTFLAFAPIAYYLISDGKLLLALVSLAGIHAVEPLPDQDFHIPGLTHRGVSHSLLAVLVVGGILGGGGWLLGEHLFDMVHRLITAGGSLWVALLGVLPSFSASILRGLVPSIPSHEVVTTLHQQAGENLRWSLGVFGFFVGAYGIITHLLGDVITTYGIKPFLPFSHWSVSLSSLHADNSIANSALLGLGVVALGLVVVATMPSVLLGAGGPAALSPVGVATAQDSGAHNASVTINETESTRTQIELANVTLPENGYIVARSGNIPANTSAGKGKVLGRTQYVRHGNFNDVVVNLSTPVNTSQTVSVTIHNDTNGDKTWDGTKTDTAYQAPDGVPIHDTVRLGVNGSESTTQRVNTTNTPANATVTLSNQTSNGSTVTVERATLPDGGFVVLSNGPYREVGTLSDSMIAVSKPLSSGTHHNISIAVNNSPPGGVVNQTALNTTSDYSVGLYRDTNNNSRFEFITSAETNDTAYEVGNGSQRQFTSDPATITVPGSNRSSSTSNASIQFRDQSTNGTSVTVDSVALPQGGFVVVHNESYLHDGDPVATILGQSRYLSAGTHRNVSVRLNDSGSLQRGQTLVAIPSQDTNDNRTYDYVRSDGFQDVPYTAINAAVTAKASVTGGGSSSSSGARLESSTASPATRTTGPNTSSQSSSANTEGDDSEGGVGKWIASNPLPAGIGVVVIVVVLPTVVRRFGQ